MTNISFRQVIMADADKLVHLLESAPPEYTRHFRPFSFDRNSIQDVISRANNDLLRCVEIHDGNRVELVGFYMLRGFDEGFPAPMYGVFIGHEYRNRGLGSLTLAHAESVCRLRRIDKLKLKVHPDNVHAKALYRIARIPKRRS